MAFWTGLLGGMTGHQAGAFKGFSLKDILDEDKRKLWVEHERLNQGRQLEETGVPETTWWYKGMGKPELMGPKVGAADVGDQRKETTLPMGVGRDRPFPLPIREAGAATALPPNELPPPQPLSGNPYKRSFSPGMSEIGGNRVPTMYNPYMFGQRPDQMGAAHWNPLNRRIRQSKQDQQGLPTSVQYSTGIRDAVRTLGGVAGNMEERLFGPPGHRTDALKDTGARIRENPTSLLGDAMDYWMPADKKTVIKKSAAPDVADTSTTTITEKMLGPSDHRMGAFKDTASDMWKNIREDDIIKYWMNQFRGN
jgi:hypothetical protein